jgi:cytochrome c biogenesis protein CcmG/thiol:disulfide interchange protein DsbE
MITDRRAGDRPSADEQQRRHRAAGRHAAGSLSGRRPGWTRLLSLLVVLAAVGLTVAACLAPKVLSTGETASSFSLPELANSHQRVSLSDYAGKPVIINFFASWSPPCKGETGLLAHFYRFYHGKVLILGVDSRDDRTAALQLMRRSLVTYPVVTDPALAVAARYGVPGIPATYFLNARHEIVKTDLGWLSWKKLRTGVTEMDPASPAARSAH